MDSNSSADPYAVLRLVAPDGRCYPSGGVFSRTLYRTVTPQWRESIELPLEGGKIDVDGVYVTMNGSKGTSLQVEVFDADVGFWGWMMRATKFTCERA